MIDMEYIRGFYPPYIAQNAGMQKHLLKEYVELLALEWIARLPYASELVFIGGTNLRLIHGIDRFSEDLDFDCKGLSGEEFMQMSDELVRYLQQHGLNAELRNKENTRLVAYRSNVYFPELLFDLQLTGHREERFLMKIEAQDQGIDYPREMAVVRRNGFSFPVPVPPLSVLLSMKLCALLTRQKGRDFYDTMFLMQRTEPDYGFLQRQKGIANKEQLDAALHEMVSSTDLKTKQRDFEHLLFDSRKSETILTFMN
ncbi:MAG: nucleotidyl transferase AbiEii/AbiGii toxin family protein [Paludibacteraceae bacterium]|nr:nucleotidyl transferase AbiEii/AbiGii toxin family protein [Paludibacteraceae bacterium]